MVQYSLSSMHIAKAALQSMLWRSISSPLSTFLAQTTKHYQTEYRAALEKAETALKQQQELLALVNKTSQDGIWDLDIASGHMWLSPRWKEMLGYSDYELDNSLATVKALMVAEDYEHSCKLADNHIKHNIPFHGVFRFRHKDSSLRHILSRAYTVKDVNGTPIRMVGTNTDLTEQVALQEKLSLHKAELSLLKHCLPCVVFQFTSSPSAPFTLTSLSGQIADLCGFSQEEIHQNNRLLFGLIHPEDKKGIIKSARQSITCWTHWNGQYRLRHQNQLRWMHTEFKPLTRTDTHVVWEGVAIDITRFRQET